MECEFHHKHAIIKWLYSKFQQNMNIGCELWSHFVNHYNETKCVFLFIAVKSEPDVDLAPEVDSSDDAVKEKPILERTRKGI